MGDVTSNRQGKGFAEESHGISNKQYLLSAASFALGCYSGFMDDTGVGIRPSLELLAASIPSFAKGFLGAREGYDYLSKQVQDSEEGYEPCAGSAMAASTATSALVKIPAAVAYRTLGGFFFFGLGKFTGCYISKAVKVHF